jgi:hypothetical protein
MMRISPCAWYCFEVGEGEPWRVEDRGDATWLSAPDGSCAIEITAARRAGGLADDDEVAGIHERYLKDEGIHAVRTALSENMHGISAYVSRGLGMDEREHVVCHAWWGRYCAFIRYRGRRERHAPERVQAFYDLVESLQPLVTQ